MAQTCTPASIDAMHVSAERFDDLVDEALAGLPADLVAGIDNLIIVIEDEPDDGSETLGWYEGVALTERDTSYGMGQLPDQIVLFKGPLTRLCRTEEQLADEIRITLVHEIGHHHGIDEARLHALGWG